MTQFLHDMNLEDHIRIRGPFGKLNYLGDGNFKILKKYKPLTYSEKKYNKIGMIAAGSGITPMYQMLITSNINKDSPQFRLIFSNKTIQDILLKDELEQMENEKNIDFKIMNVLSRSNDEWKGLKGWVTKDIIKDFLPPPEDDVIILLCGPIDMIKKTLFPALNEL